ncbi:MAG: hypothetical protein JEY97_01395 [Bacteroidales bacterium]|nr:hypothetical protein [Bacteroidales bacterium]
MPYWNYSGIGKYFITICVNDRNCIFGYIENDKMMLNEYGKIAYNEWEVSVTIRDEIELDAFIIMPNHLHGIVVLKKTNMNMVCGSDGLHNGSPDGLSDGSPVDSHDDSHVEMHGRASLPENQPENQNPFPQKPQRKPKSISSFIAGFKSAVTTKINNLIDLRMQANDYAPQFNITKFNRKNKLWQANYHDHVIRNNEEFYRIKKYIINYPSKWEQDKFYK